MSSPRTIDIEIARVVGSDKPHDARFVTQEYSVRTSGGGREVFTIPWGDGLLPAIEALHGEDPDPDAAQQVGDRLAAMLDTTDWPATAATFADGQPVRLRLRFAAAELYALPWELVTLKGSGRHLAELDPVQLSYAWPEARPSPRGQPTNRLLFAWSAAGGPVPAGPIAAAIARITAEAGLPFDPAMDICPQASPESLAAALDAADSAGRPFAGLILLAHGQRQESGAALALHQQDLDEPDPVDGRRLARLLGLTRSPLRLVVLAACEAGDAGHTGSLAQWLHRAGTEAVVASRLPLSTRGALKLVEQLLRNLLVAGLPIGPAFTKARAALARTAANLDWAALQLYAHDGCAERWPLNLPTGPGAAPFTAAHRLLYAGRDPAPLVAALQAALAGQRDPLVLLRHPAGAGATSYVEAAVLPALAGVTLWRGEGSPPAARPLLQIADGALPPTLLRDPQTATLLVLREGDLHRATADAAIATPAGSTGGAAASFGPASTAALPGAPTAAPIGPASTNALSGATAAATALPSASAAANFGPASTAALPGAPAAAVLAAVAEALPAFTPAGLRLALTTPYARAGRPIEESLLVGLIEQLLARPTTLGLAAAGLAALAAATPEGPIGEGATAELLLHEAAAQPLRAALATASPTLRRLLVSLVDLASGQAQAVPLEALRPSPRAATVDALLRPLLDQRVLREEVDGGTLRLSLALPTLVEELQAAIHIEGEHLRPLQELRAEAAAYAAHRADPDEGATYLLTGTRLGYARELLRQHPDELGDGVIAFVAMSADRPRVLADQRVAAAAAEQAQAADLLAQAARQRAAAAQALAALPAQAPVAAKRPHWAAEDAAQELQAEAERRTEEALGHLEAALQIAPDHPPARARLADHHAERLQAYEEAGETLLAQRALQRVRRYASPALEALLRGDGRLSLRTDPPAAVTLADLRPVDRRLVPGPPRDLGSTPLLDLALPMGSYLLRLEAPGRAPIAYPVFLRRCGQWDPHRPGDPAPYVLRLPQDLRPDEVFVAAGPVRLGGDPQAAAALPAQEVWVDSFAIQRHPTTNADWLDYLHALKDAGRLDRALAAVPRERAATAEAQGAQLFPQGPDGRFHLPVDADGHAWAPDWPILMVTALQARDYARWRAARDGLPYRLPTEREWEKAARGVDGRIYPWGDHLDPTFCAMAESHDGSPAPVPISAFPADESPYGLRGLGGNAKDLCADAWEQKGPPPPDGIDHPPPDEPFPEAIATRGGSWSADRLRCRAAARASLPSASPAGFVTVRLARSI